MVKEQSKQAVHDFIESARREFDSQTLKFDYSQIENAAQLILDTQANGGRVHITGIGKPGHVSSYIASLMSSTGNPCYFLDGTEAYHGSSGQLIEGDVVIAISNSGETNELKTTVTTVKDLGCKLIGVSGNADSWLALNSDAFLLAHVDSEGGPLNRAPRNSVIAEMLVLQALSVLLQEEKGLDPVEYVRHHPGGKLGQLRDDEKR